MNPDSDDCLADDLVLDVPTPHKTLSQKRPSPRNHPHGRHVATEDEPSWYSRFGADDSDSIDDDRSHDLTYLAGRASVMDNMLLSLDQLEPSPSHSRNASFQQPNLPDFSLESSAPPRAKRNPSRRHNHGHSSSYSSGFNISSDVQPGRRMPGRSRAESGSSSATFRAGSSRGEKELSGNEPSDASADGRRKRFPGDSSGTALHSQHIRGARAKGSKNSNSSSFDMGYRGASLAPPPGLGALNHPARRTASMDQLPYLGPGAGVNGASPIMQRANPVHSSNYDFFDAAPTPTVLQGPRKMSSTTFGQPSPVLSQAPLSPLLGSSRPATSTRIRKAKTEIPDASVFRAQANEFVDSATLQEKPMPGFNCGEFPAPSPNLSSSQKGWQSVSAATPAMTRERPGFFRRVFGSSKSNTPSTSIPTAPQQYLSSPGDSFIADALSQPQPQQQHYQQHQHQHQHRPYMGSHHIASQMRSHQVNNNQRPSITDSSLNEQEQTPFPPPATPSATLSAPALTKKHSSFFRRRKKSVSDAIRGSPTAASVIPQQQPLGNFDVDINRQHQSISSLRQVMNPYLGTSEPTDVYFETSENQLRYPHVEKLRDNSGNGATSTPLHIGNPSATIRAVNPSGSRERTDWSLTYLGNEMAENIYAAGNMNIDSPKFKLKMRGRSNSSAIVPADATNNTFYAENSSAEASNQNILGYLDVRDDAGPLDGMSKARPVTSPTAPNPSQPRFIPVKGARQRVDDKQLVVPGDKLANSPSSPQQEFHNATSWVTSSETSLVEPADSANRHHHHPNHAPPPLPPSSTPTSAAPKASRVWLHPGSSDENLEEPNRAPPPPPLPHSTPSNADTPRFSSTKSTPSSMHDAFQSATSLPALHPGGGDADDENKAGGDVDVASKSKDGLTDPAAETPSLKRTGLGIVRDQEALPKMSPRVRDPMQNPDALALAVAAAADAAARSDPIINAGPESLSEPLSASSPTLEDRAIAQHIFDGTDDFASSPDRAMGVLGDTDTASARVRQAYMELFNWSGVNILMALRALCGSLLLRGESQQMDRVLDAFSERWCACNVNHGFKARDVVHTISYSILLLNTDLHLANIEHKMTRTQFVKNTLPTIKRVVADAVPDCWDQTVRVAASQKKNSIPWTSAAAAAADKENMSPSSPSAAGASGDVGVGERRPSLEITTRGRNRLSIRSPLIRSESDTMLSIGASAGNMDPAVGLLDNCNVLVRFPYDGPLQGWETHLEIILKAFYDSIRRQPLPLFGSNCSNAGPAAASLGVNEPVSSSLSVMTSSMLRRTPSVMSKAPSESLSLSYRGGGGGGSSSIGGGGGGSTGTFSDFRSAGFRWASKSRSRPRVYHSSTMGSSTSRTSLDDHSPWSPAGSSTWSRFSHSRTQPTTASVDSFRSQFTQPEFQQSIGFANALSQAIIREEGIASAAAMAAAANGNAATGTNTEVSIAESSPEDLISRTAPLLDDETLELAGAPWAKEGILKHKHHLEALDKRAKDRAWSECFAVVEKGYMKLFSFGAGKSSTLSSSTTSRLRTGRMPRGRRAASVSNVSGGAVAGAGGTTVVGGGNWSSNAVPLGSFLLRQTIASALPPPGYSKTRPHVWALSLPTGAVHLFQAGTLDIVREFVSTANYWSARLSKEPLVGGVSNIEYGWGEGVLGAVDTKLQQQQHDWPSAAIPSAFNGRLGSGAGSKISLSLPGRPPSSSTAAAAPRPMSPSSVSTLSAAYQQQQRPSIHGSIRSSMDHNAGGNGAGAGSTKMRLPGDRVTVSEWTPPTQSMMASALLEVDQLRALTDYVKNIEDELSRHNELRGALGVAYTPRHPNHARAVGNWERKSAYLLREIVKFRTYIDSLTAAQALREKVYAERDKGKSLTEGVEASELVARVAGSGGKSEGVERSRSRDSGRGSRESESRGRGRKTKRDSSIAGGGGGGDGATAKYGVEAGENMDPKATSTEASGGITAATAPKPANPLSDSTNATVADRQGGLARKERGRAASSVSVSGKSISRSRSREFWRADGAGGAGVRAGTAGVGAA